MTLSPSNLLPTDRSRSCILDSFFSGDVLGWGWVAFSCRCPKSRFCGAPLPYADPVFLGERNYHTPPPRRRRVGWPLITPLYRLLLSNNGFEDAISCIGPLTPNLLKFSSFSLFRMLRASVRAHKERFPINRLPIIAIMVRGGVPGTIVDLFKPSFFFFSKNPYSFGTFGTSTRYK